MLHIAWWLAYFVPVAGMGVGGLYWFLTQVPTTAAREMQQHPTPAGVTLTPASAQAIHDELDRRKRVALYAGCALYCVTVAALHPMYAPGRLSEGAGLIAYCVAIGAGLLVGETYVATRAAQAPRPSRRFASPTPREVPTYLSPAQRVLQAGLLFAAAIGATTLTVLVFVDDDLPAWVGYARPACLVWLAVLVVVLAVQRHLLARRAPIDAEQDPLVREYVMAAAMQLLHRSTWGLGLLIYAVTVSIGLGPDADAPALMLWYLPVLGAAGVIAAGVRLLHRPDPFWHFARTGSLA